MCGITAAFALESHRVRSRREPLERAARALNHRGPDATGIWEDPSGRASLLHTRLSIIDLNTGNQPLAGCSAAVQLVHNGEFYDFESVRRSLGDRGHRLRSCSDSEILAHLYEEKGTACLDDLRGEFAFALWDSHQERLFAARDRFGIKPLFYTVHEGELWLASEMKALFAAGVPARWDEEMLFQLHAGMLLHPARTLFHAIYQVPPGHYLLASRGRVELHSYWDFDYPTADAKKNCPSLPEAIEQVRSVLVESVRLRLRADVRVGCYLSGGLDSCTALGIAATLSAEPVAAFTLTFDDPRYDEGAIAAEQAALSHADFRPIPMRSDALAEHFEEALWHAETPFINAHGIAKFLMSREVHRAGYRVVLTGEGSDEIFGGYAHFRRDWLLQQSGSSPEDIQRQLAELEQTNSVSKGFLLPGTEGTSLESVRRRLGFIPSFLENFAQLGKKTAGLLAAPMRRDRDAFVFFLDEVDSNRQLRGREPVEQSLYLWSKMMLPNYLLSVLGDRMEMANSVEGRLPFLDHRLVELVVKMPVEYKIRGMTEKYLLREAAKPFLTDTVYRRQKHPFLAPPAAGRKRDALLDMTQDILRSRETCAPFYDSAAIGAMLDGLNQADADTREQSDPGLMIALSMSLMHKRFGVSA